MTLKQLHCTGFSVLDSADRRPASSSRLLTASTTCSAALLLLCSVSSHAAAVDAQAQAASSGNLLDSDIVVTANRRDEQAQKVGISITAFSGDQLNGLGVKGSADLTKLTPGLQLQTSGGEGNTMAFTMRGVGQNDFNDHQEGPIAIYVDNVYSSALTGTSFLAFDLDRVEVLRGPQGTLFGRNATGGLVHFVTRKPTYDWEGYASIGYGRFNSFSAEAAVGGPVTDTVQMRLSIATEQRDAYFKNNFPSGLGGNAKNNYAGRLQVAWQPSETLNLRLVARGAEAKNVGPRARHGTSYIDATTGLANAVPANVDYYGTGPGNDIAGYRNRNSNYWSGEFDQNNPLSLSQHGATLHADLELGAVKLFSITDYSKFNHHYREDSDLGPVRGQRYAADSGIRQLSQELRLNFDSSFVNVTAGAYFLDINGTYENVFIIYRAYAEPLGFVSPGSTTGIGSLVPWTTKTQSYSAFGQAEWRFTDQLKLITGVRWTYDQKRQKLDSYVIDVPDSQDTLNLSDPKTSLLTNTYRDSRSDRFVSWKGELDYTPNDRTLLFASITRGQKGGGYNPPFFAEDSQLGIFSFKPEQLTSYEGGVKISGLGLVRRLNASVYRYDYKNYQAFQFLHASSLVFNTDAKVDGADVEILLSPVRGLTVQLGGAFIFKATAENIGLPNGVSADRRIPLSPDYQLSGILRYDFSVANGSVGLQVDGRYTASQYFDVFNNPITNEGKYGVVNARVQYNLDQPDLEFSLSVENITNTKYRVFGVDLGTSLMQQWLGSPRMWSLSARYKFGGK